MTRVVVAAETPSGLGAGSSLPLSLCRTSVRDQIGHGIEICTQDPAWDWKLPRDYLV
jgi:hypothetical protein